MTFEGLLPFILLFIMWGASQILLKMGKTGQKKQAPTDKKPGFLKMLQEHLADLEEQGKDEEFDEYFQPPSQPPEEELKKESLIETTKDSLPQEPPITDRKKVSVSPPIGAAKPRHTSLCKKPLATMNRHKLKNAVIWAEILAPPVALRD
ncbi:hypothetical protein ACFLZ5_04235 [Thermodesulfobacteriota bacterium]